MFCFLDLVVVHVCIVVVLSFAVVFSLLRYSFRARFLSLCIAFLMSLVLFFLW